MDSWGLQIKRLRIEKLGLTQQELADKAGLTRSNIATIESGRPKDLRGETAQKLARALEISLAELNQIIKGAPAAIPSKSLSAMPPSPLEPALEPVELEVYDVAFVHASDAGMVDPVDKIRISPPSKTSRLSALRVRGTCLAPDILEGDYLVLNENAPVDLGDIVVCSDDGEYRIGYLRRIEENYYIKNGDGMYKLADCKKYAKVVDINRRPKKNLE